MGKNVEMTGEPGDMVHVVAESGSNKWTALKFSAPVGPDGHLFIHMNDRLLTWMIQWDRNQFKERGEFALLRPVGS